MLSTPIINCSWALLPHIPTPRHGINQKYDVGPAEPPAAAAAAAAPPAAAAAADEPPVESNA